MFKSFIDANTSIIESENLQKKAVWIHAEALSIFETLQLTGRFHVEKDLLSDAHDPNEVPRLEFEEKVP
jgi:hypothetical protein